ncbi:hypothetical protein JCM1840_002966 [Sporobolomyces johnsonii]
MPFVARTGVALVMPSSPPPSRSSRSTNTSSTARAQRPARPPRSRFTTDDPCPKPTTTPQPPKPGDDFTLSPYIQPRPAGVPLFFAFSPEESEAHLHPVELFPSRDRVHPFLPVAGPRFRHWKNPMWTLVQVDGACLYNGQGDRQRAAWSMCWGPAIEKQSSSCAGILEGPPEKHTSQRAELRALLAVLHYRQWDQEGTSHLVIATDSEYVARGCTEWLPKWQRNVWVNARGQPIANQDLWTRVVDRMNYFGDDLRVGLWRIDRELNKRADKIANDMARSDKPAPPDGFRPVRGR